MIQETNKMSVLKGFSCSHIPLFFPFIKKYCIVCVCLVWFPLVSAVGVRLRSSDRQRLPAAAADPNSRGQQWRRSLQDRSHACLERNVLRSDGNFLIILIIRGITILKYMFFFHRVHGVYVSFLFCFLTGVLNLCQLVF